MGRKVISQSTKINSKHVKEFNSKNTVIKQLSRKYTWVSIYFMMEQRKAVCIIRVF